MTENDTERAQCEHTTQHSSTTSPAATEDL